MALRHDNDDVVIAAEMEDQRMNVPNILDFLAEESSPGLTKHSCVRRK